MAKKKSGAKPPKGKPGVKASADKRLLELFETAQAPVGPLVTSRKIFDPFLAITRSYLEVNRNSDTSRKQVGEMAFHFRQEAMRRFGHDTIETFELANLLRLKLPEAEKRGRPDAVTHIMSNPIANLRLDVEEVAAADYIKQVWEAMGKGLSGGSRDFSRVGGSGTILHPLDTMDQDLWVHYRTIYQAWHRHAARIGVGRKNTGEAISVAAIVFRALVEDIYPEALDAMFSLRKGLSLKVIKAALACYWSPDQIKARLAPPKPKPQPAATRQEGGAKEGAAPQPPKS